MDLSAIFIPVIFLHFVLAFLDKKYLEKYKKILFFSYFWSVFLTFFSFSPYFKKGVAPLLKFNFWVQPGDFYFIFPLTFLCLAIYSLAILITNYPKFDQIKKIQTRYILLASIIGFTSGATNFFPQLLGIYPFGNFFIFLYLLFIVYAITKHHLMNIRVIATEIFSLSIAIALLTYLIFSPSIKEFLIRGCVFLFVSTFAIFLVKGTWREVESLEKIVKKERELATQFQVIAIRAEALKKNFEEMAERERKLRLETERLSEAKDQFILSTQHYFRTPLSTILGYSSLILEGIYGEVPPKLKEKISHIFFQQKNSKRE